MDENIIPLTPAGQAALASGGAVELTPEEKQKVDEIAKTIDISNSQQILQYGIGAQSNISSFADNILSQVRAKDSGYVGEIMTDLVLNIKDLEIDKLSQDKGFLSKLPFVKGFVDSFKKFTEKYEKLDVQIEKISGQLDDARIKLLKDIGMFDMLYQKNLEYFKELVLYIEAGEQKLKEVNEQVIPELKKQAQASSDPMDAQKVNDMVEAANRFEKKIHDLKLSKMISIQTAPQVRLIQNNDQLLVDKIQTSIFNTLPLWKNQIIIAIGLFRQQKALQMQKQITDTTNELLLKNSEMLKSGTIEIAKESERGIVEIETLKKVNADLISTIEETIKIQQDGRVARAQAETELTKMEGELKSQLTRAKG